MSKLLSFWGLFFVTIFWLFLMHRFLATFHLRYNSTYFKITIVLTASCQNYYRFEDLWPLMLSDAVFVWLSFWWCALVWGGGPCQMGRKADWRVLSGVSQPSSPPHLTLHTCVPDTPYYLFVTIFWLFCTFRCCLPILTYQTKSHSHPSGRPLESAVWKPRNGAVFSYQMVFLELI